MSTLAHIRNWLRYPSLTALSKDDSVMRKAETLVMAFYVIVPVVAYAFFRNWPIPLTRENFDPIWPLFWSEALALSDDVTISIIRAMFLIASLLGMLFYRYRVMRLLVFIGVWQAHAFASSFGSVVHELYPWVYAALIFVFLPSFDEGRAGMERNRRLLLIIWWAQASLMLLYTMAGVWKFHAAFVQLLAGEIHGLSPLAFAYQVADWVQKLQQEAPLAAFVIAHPLIVWPLYVGSHFFQLFAFWTMIRPSLQKIWAFELMLFHIGTFMVMGIEFDPFIFIVIVLLFFSPFIPEKLTLKQIFLDLPVIGQIAEYYIARRKNATS
ncbi:MAG: hypothetical protein Athens041674_190 [Parcubacteria group bacterium Athens0416_74]|nr:MAG: hypothetical protein Athens041674_190 [Parcubacteria group bacterium Athens0416_74]